MSEDPSSILSANTNRWARDIASSKLLLKRPEKVVDAESMSVESPAFDPALASISKSMTLVWSNV